MLDSKGSLTTESGKKPIVIFTIASPGQHTVYAQRMVNSFKKFHPDIPIQIRNFDPKDNFRIYAIHGKELAKEYDLVINIDNDSIVTGNLDHIFNDKTWDIGGVLNNNVIDPKLKLWDTPWEYYVNCGFIAARSERFWNWWHQLNYSPHFQAYRFREQDMLNIIFHYGDLKTKIFDLSSNWHGLIHKGQWHKFILEDDPLSPTGKTIILPKDENITEKKTIKVIHWAGGNVAKQTIWPNFEEPIAKYLNWLMSEEHGKY